MLINYFLKKNKKVSLANDFAEGLALRGAVLSDITSFLFTSEITPFFALVNFSFDIFSAVFLAENFISGQFETFYLWFLSSCRKNDPFAINIIFDFLGIERVMDNPNNAYLLPLINSDAFLIDPNVAAIFIICHHFDIKLNLYSFLPIEITEISTKVFGALFIIFTINFAILILYFILISIIRATTINRFLDESNTDYSTNNARFIIECEKEISALDDILIPSILFFLIYGWMFLSIPLYYFRLNSMLFQLAIAFPALWFLVVWMPLNILYDYGITFSSFLRGASASTIFLFELLYDCLATMIMLVRLMVQNVRFILMFFAYLELVELIYTTGLVRPAIMSSESDYYEALYSQYLTDGFIFTFLSQFPDFILRYLYQVTHLIFMLVAHSIAYLALVFWLFSFLYTCFFDKNFENYFNAKRQKYKDMFN